MAFKKKKEKRTTPAGKLSPTQIKNLINRTAGRKVAHNLAKGVNPAEIPGWIPTGSHWLDSIIAQGQIAGIPLCRMTEIAGLPSSGKSYMAAQIAKNAQNMGIVVVYFDSETAADPKFLERAGCDLDALHYVQATSVEMVLEVMEHLLDGGEQRYLFILDSLANCPCASEIEGGFNPRGDIAVKARVLSLGMSKINIPLADTESTFLVLNQLKTNITSDIAERFTTPWFTPGGKTMAYNYSLRIWLTSRKANKSYITDDRGYRIGSEVKCKLEKSRFGTDGRRCFFQIKWGGDEVRIMDEESWFEAIKSSEHLDTGQWNTLRYSDGSEKKFQAATWMEALEDQKFRDRVLELIEEENITKFDTKMGQADNYYGDDEEQKEELKVAAANKK